MAKKDKKFIGGFGVLPEVLSDRKAGSIASPRLALKHAGLRQGMSIADLGCGSGFFTIPAARMTGDLGKVYAVDILQTALDHVKSRAKLEGLRNIKYVWADLEKVGSTKIKPGTIDIVLLSSTMHQVPGKDNLLEEAKRVLSPNGKLVVFEWETSNIPIGPRSKNRIDEKEVIAACKKHGLKLFDAFKPGRFHYGLVFVRE